MGIAFLEKTMGIFISVARKDEDPTDPEVVGVGGPWKLDGLHIGLPAGCYCDAWCQKGQNRWQATDTNFGRCRF